MDYLRQQPSRSYTYKNFRPYGASEIFVMDHLVPHDFGGNVPEEIMRNGGRWDEREMIMRCGNVPVYFVKMEE